MLLVEDRLGLSDENQSENDCKRYSAARQSTLVGVAQNADLSAPTAVRIKFAGLALDIENSRSLFQHGSRADIMACVSAGLASDRTKPVPKNPTHRHPT